MVNDSLTGAVLYLHYVICFNNLGLQFYKWDNYIVSIVLCQQAL